MSTLDNSIRSLLKVISQIQNGSNSGDFMKSSKPYWHICTEKFYAAYIKAKNPEGFRSMFYEFFEKRIDKFTEDVVDSDGDINDEWLKNKEVMSTKTSKKKKIVDETSFSLRNINCRGEVIYFDESNEKIKNVSIPISEAYLAACKIYSEGAKKGEYSPLPAQLLVALFTVISEVCGSEHKKELENNVKSLKDVVDQLTNGEETTSTQGSTLDNLGSILNAAKSKLGIDLGKDMDFSNIEKTVSNIFDSDITGKVKNIWGKFNDKVNMNETKDLGSIISSVTDIMKDSEIQADLQDAITSVASKAGFGEIKFSEEDKEKISPSNADADNQE